MKITREWTDPETGKEVWETDGDLHCVRCGKAEVWTCDMREDFYAGVPHVCLACGAGWHMHGPPVDTHYTVQLAKLQVPMALTHLQQSPKDCCK